MFDSMQLDWLGFTFRPENPTQFWAALCKKNNIKPTYVTSGGVEYNSDLLLPPLIDMFWLTFPELEVLKTELCVVKGGSQYPVVLSSIDNIRINFCDRGHSYETEYEILGVNVQIPSHALASFFKLFDFDLNDIDLIKLTDLLHSRSCHFSRLDLAFDDYERKYTPAWYSFMCKDVFDYNTLQIVPNSRHVRSRMKNFWDIKGETFYCGNRKHGKLLRIYDKNIESDGMYNCIRYEFELHSDYAEYFLAYYLYGVDKFGMPIIDRKENPFSFAEYFLNNWFEIINRDDSNISRCSVNSEWLDWLNSTTSQFNAILAKSEPATIPVVVKQYSAEELLAHRKRWIEKNVSKTLSELSKYYGLEWTRKILNRDSMRELMRVQLHVSEDDLLEYYSDIYECLYD